MAAGIVPTDELMSGLQKYIRRGMTEKALMCCRDLLERGCAEGLVRRLLVTSGEDVSIGDPRAVMLVWFRIRELWSHKTTSGGGEGRGSARRAAVGLSITWEKVAPLVPVLCAAEKTREFAHIYFAVFDDETRPTKPLTDCLASRDLELARWLKFENQDHILRRIASRDARFGPLVRLAIQLAKTVKENIWIYGFVVLLYLRDILPSGGPSDDGGVLSEVPEIPKGPLEVDDFVVDKHTKRGRQLGKDLKDFVHVGAIVVPESAQTTLEFKRIHDEMHG